MTDRADDAVTPGPLGRGAIARAFLDACRAELTALKVGNVHAYSAGHGMEVAQFEAAAEAAAPFIGDPRLAFGARVRSAVAASMAAAGCNTNLGIILLCTPLAAALGSDAAPLRERVGSVLAGLDRMDAEHVFAAIRLANPGGLGKSDEADVADKPSVGLLDAMRIAAPRDRIAANYVSGLADIFDDHLPRLRDFDRFAREQNLARDWSVTTLHLDVLARHPDSHVGRKHGTAAAARVQSLAREARAAIGRLATPADLEHLRALDALLKHQGFNPGTTADFVVATLFADILMSADCD